MTAQTFAVVAFASVLVYPSWQGIKVFGRWIDDRATRAVGRMVEAGLAALDDEDDPWTGDYADDDTPTYRQVLADHPWVAIELDCADLRRELAADDAVARIVGWDK